MLKIKGVVELQVENLLALADYLLKLPDGYENFEMGMYSEYTSPQKVRSKNSCGTAGCAIGHAPLLDLPINDISNVHSAIDRTFAGYSNEFAFGHNVFELKMGNELYSDISCFIWDFLFSSDWSLIDNTPQGAGKRILFLLANPDAIENSQYCEYDPVSRELYNMYNTAELTVEKVKGKVYNESTSINI